MTGTFVVDPYTSDSTLTDSPSIVSPIGYGWRTAAVIGSNVPAGTWSFTVTTQASVTSLVANGRVKIFAYSSDTLGSSVSSIGSATGTRNVFSVLGAQTETITFSSSSVDLTGKIVVVEYWIDVTSGPALATTVTFHTGSLTQTIVPPSNTETLYLAKPSLFSIGQSESFSLSDTQSRFISLLRSNGENAAANDSPVLRNIITSRNATEVSSGFSDSLSKSAGFTRAVSEPSGAGVGDSINRSSLFIREIVEGSEAMVSDSISRIATYSRLVTELSGALINEGPSRVAGYIRDISETSGAMASDTILRLAIYARELSDPAGVVGDLISILTDLIIPSDDDDESSETEKRSRGGRAGSINLVFEPAYFHDRPLEKIEYTRLALVNSKAAQFSSIDSGEEITLSLQILNRQSLPQQYSLILQVIDSENVAIDIIITSGYLESGKVKEHSLSWATGESEEYILELLVWDEQWESPQPLGEKISKRVPIRQ